MLNNDNGEIKDLNQIVEKIVKKYNRPRTGYRYFKCDELDCNYYWSEESRDCLSPSSEVCPKCHSLIYPHAYTEHPLNVDMNGNLIKGIEDV